MLNINIGHNEDLMNACRTLGDYAEFTSRMREYTGHMSLDDAAERAITECIREGILAEFLSANRAEAKKVTIFEYDAEKHMKMEREESYQMDYRSRQESGFASGMALTKNVIRLSESGLSYSEIALKENVSEDIIRSILQ